MSVPQRYRRRLATPRDAWKRQSSSGDSGTRSAGRFVRYIVETNSYCSVNYCSHAPFAPTWQRDPVHCYRYRVYAQMAPQELRFGTTHDADDYRRPLRPRLRERLKITERARKIILPLVTSTNSDPVDPALPAYRTRSNLCRARTGNEVILLFHEFHYRASKIFVGSRANSREFRVVNSSRYLIRGDTKSTDRNKSLRRQSPNDPFMNHLCYRCISLPHFFSASLRVPRFVAVARDTRSS